MRKSFHILNGDALKKHFPVAITGEQVVARECLVDGSVQGHTPEELYQTRARFITGNYGGSESDYFKKTVVEFKKIEAIPDESEVNLWFEDDLFCQVNFWFVLYLLKDSKCSLFLVRPRIHTRYGFGGLNSRELSEIYADKLALSALDELSGLWPSYQNGNTATLYGIAERLKDLYPFLLPAVQAYEESIPTKESPGRPMQQLIQIKEELNTEEFALIFNEFSEREPIYGFGDLQVKRLLEQLSGNPTYQ